MSVCTHPLALALSFSGCGWVACELLLFCGNTKLVVHFGLSTFFILPSSQVSSKPRQLLLEYVIIIMTVLTHHDFPLLRPHAIASHRRHTWASCFARTRRWCVEQDWYYKLNDILYVIPSGFVFDGASVPTMFHSCRGPVGVLLLAALIHDWGYHHASLARCHAPSHSEYEAIPMTRREMDRIFREVSPGQRCMRWLSYLMVRIGGGRAWRRHRQRSRARTSQVRFRAAASVKIYPCGESDQ